ncbi:cef modifier of supressor tRNAs [Erwinia phage Cronus]|uniref:Modifier of suppressor tRNAs n=1 Tax=Erwinia phage Cronus TaxID=2163633 RepID=A0A2S1GM33_9CAUD|nr:cef modifier of supressor tRNAs [Erwinia phage Cronus]AWD90446.1 hypothetical protein [Erwinia phage Cronus]
MKNSITQDQFEDIQFDPSLVVVQKEHTHGKEWHITTLYVFDKVGDKTAVAIYEREITAQGTTYSKVK